VFRAESYKFGAVRVALPVLNYLGNRRSTVKQHGSWSVCLSSCTVLVRNTFCSDNYLANCVRDAHIHAGRSNVFNWLPLCLIWRGSLM